MGIIVLAIVIGALVVITRAKPKAEVQPEITEEAGVTPFVSPEEYAEITGEPLPITYKEYQLRQGAFEWELQSAIEAGSIPPPPQRDLITIAAWYWNGHEWITKTRPGFEPVQLIL